MTGIRKRLESELRRLADGPLPSEQIGGIGTVRFIARCTGDASDILERVKQILIIIDTESIAGWPAEDEWKNILPNWFVSVCAPSRTREQAEQWVTWWKTLPPDEQARVKKEKKWALDDWLYWMQPDNRQWFWWDAKALEDVTSIVVAVEVDGWPFPWGALRWLFIAAGAIDLNAEAEE